MTAVTCVHCGQPPLPAREVCAAHERRRRSQREYMRRRRARERADRQRTAMRCTFRLGQTECGGQLRADVDRRFGRTVLVCDWCERRKAGLCRDCPRPVAGTIGRALRCAECRRLANNASKARHVARNHDETLARARAAYADPVVRERRNEYKRRWRKANRDKVRAQKRRAALRQPRRVLSYQKRYRAKHAAYLAEQRRMRYRQQHPVPTPVCVVCGRSIPWEPPGRPYRRCDQCVFPCERRRREALRARRQAAAAEAPDVGLPPKPVKVRRPRQPAVRTATGEKCCITPGCSSVVPGRAKKCPACKAVERDLAVTLLAPRARGVRRHGSSTAQQSGRAA